MKRQCKGFRISLGGRTKYFVFKIIEILHIHLLLLKRVTLDWFPLLIPGVGNADFSRVSCSWDQNHIIEGIHHCTVHLNCSKLQK